MSLLQFDSELGVILPSTEEIRADIGAKIQAAFQTKPTDPVLNIEPSSPMGQVLDLLVAEIEAKNAEIVFIANMADPNTAQGRFLDALAALYGIRRKISEPTIVSCVCTGLVGTQIPFGAIAQDENGNQYRCLALSNNVIGSTGQITLDFESITHGAIEVAAGTLNRIVTVVAGWDTITNPVAGIVGRDRETDAEVRDRIKESYAHNATDTVESIKANIADVSGVIDVEVLENATNQLVTEHGIDIQPHSVAIAVSGGEDADIAKVIYERKSGGCGTSGSYTVQHTTAEDATYSYKITRPVAGAVRIQIDIVASSISDSLAAAIKQAVLNDFLGLGANNRVGLAQSLYASRFYAPVQEVTILPVRMIQVALNDGAFDQVIEIPATIEPSLSADYITINLV